MDAFNWKIGTMPKCWRAGDILHVRNGDFRCGRTAAVEQTTARLFLGGVMPVDDVHSVRFDYIEERKVRAWLAWFKTLR